MMMTRESKGSIIRGIFRKGTEFCYCLRQNIKLEIVAKSSGETKNFFAKNE